MENKEGFQYTYSAAQQQEIANIREKYLPKAEDKMERLRKLDHSATQKAQAYSIALGVIGALLLGSGMSLFMTDLAQKLGFIGYWVMALGIMIGLVGIVLVALAYPVYNLVLKKERARIAPQILQLTEELLQ